MSVGFVNVKQHESLNRYYISSEGKEVWQVGGFRSSVSFINALMEAYNPVKSCVFADGPYGMFIDLYLLSDRYLISIVEGRR